MAIDKDAISALQFISQTQRDAFTNRRNVEWKIFYTALTFDVLSVGAKLKVELDLSSYVKYIWIAYLLLSIVSSIFLLYLSRAHHINKSSAHKAEHAILKLLKDEQLVENDLQLYSNHKRCFSFKRLYTVGEAGNWAWFWQTVVLILFAVSAALLLSI